MDIVSGSWPGEVYWFRRKPDGTFSDRVALVDTKGEVIKVGLSSATFVIDWHHDGDLDLVVGTFDGRVELVENHSSSKELHFGESVPLAIDRPHKEHHSETAPTIADWDGDGREDLLIGDEDGSIFWCKNVGSATEPAFAKASCLVPKSPVGWSNQHGEGDWGLRSKLCVTDWNGDCKLDLLLGDLCGGFQGKPAQLDDEREAERHALAELPSLQRDWAECFRYYRSLPKEQVADAKSVLAEIKSLKVRIAKAQTVASKYKPQRQSHGFVWLFLRE